MAKSGFYSKLKKEFPSIARQVKAFPEAVQAQAFETLYNAFVAESGGSVPIVMKSSKDSLVRAGSTQPNGLEHVAEMRPDGEIELVARDLKAQTLKDAVQRVVYLAIRANQLLTGKESVDNRKVVHKSLKKYRLTSGSAYNALSKVPGIIKVGNEWSLDGPAKDEADKYIKEVADDSIQGKFFPGTISRPKNKQTNPKSKQK